jgi:hypothetical protein
MKNILKASFVSVCKEFILLEWLLDQHYHLGVRERWWEQINISSIVFHWINSIKWN